MTRGKPKRHMTEATDLTFAARRADDVRLIAGVSAAHFVSHFYMLVLPPLFAFVRRTMRVSYTELGLALTMFNAVSAVAQTPAGFLIDRINARLALVAGLLLGAIGFAVAGLVNSFWVLIAVFGALGLGNTVYHPADYALLSRHVAPERMSHAYSVHTFAGMLGSAAAPSAVLLMHGLYGWRGAFVGAAALGVAGGAGAVVHARRRSPSPGRQNCGAGVGSHQLAAAADGADPDEFPVLHNLRVRQLRPAELFGGGARPLHGTSPVAANSALTGYLLLSALGVLVGGLIAGRMTNHRLIAALGLSATVLRRGPDRQRRPRRAAVDPGDVARRTVRRHRDAVARHDRARGDAAGRVRQGVRLRHHRLSHRRHPGAAAVCSPARPRRAARDFLRDRRIRASCRSSLWRACRGEKRPDHR